MSNKYDAFLSYNSSIYGEVAWLYDCLVGSGLSVFLDKKCIPRRRPRREEIDRALEVSDSAMVIIGPNGAGPWQEEGNYAFQTIAAAPPSHRLIIPIFLPGASKPNNYPSFLNRYDHLSFRLSAHDDLNALMPLLREAFHGEHPEERRLLGEKDDLSASTRRFYEANRDIYLNQWKDGVPPELYAWLLAFLR